MLTRRFVLTAAAVALAALTQIVPELMPRAAAQPGLDVQLSVPRGRRGVTITLTACVTSGGRPCAGIPVEFIEEWNGRRVSLGYGWTDGNGLATCPYRIPTDPRMDNVYIRATTRASGFRNATTTQRVPIG